MAPRREVRHGHALDRHAADAEFVHQKLFIERAAEAALRTPGVTGVVLNIGGDLVVRGAAGDKVSVVDPRSDAENSDPVAVLNVQRSGRRHQRKLSPRF